MSDILLFNIGAHGLPPEICFKNSTYSLAYSQHAIEESVWDRYGSAREYLPTSMNLREMYQKGRIVEAEVCRNTGRLLKVVVRVAVDACDLVMVLVADPRKTGHEMLGFCKTTWQNSVKDLHFSLDKSRFHDPKKFWR